MSDQWPPGEQPDWLPGDRPDPARYPRQELLPQEVRPGRNRTPVFIAIGVAVALIVAGVGAYFVFRDNGEDTRTAYCAALRNVTKNGDLEAAATGANASTLEDLKAVVDLAPNAVADDWQKLTTFAEDAQKSGGPDFGQAMTAYGALREIASDADSKCSLSLDIPIMP
jgi:hypothetical protein